MPQSAFRRLSELAGQTAAQRRRRCLVGLLVVLLTVGLAILEKQVTGAQAVDVEALFGSSDLLHQQAVQIATALRTRPERGVLLLTRGGWVEPVFYVPWGPSWHHWRSPLMHAILSAAARNVPAGYILHVGFEDNDMYIAHAPDFRNSRQAAVVDHLTANYTNLFWLHRNPTVIDKTMGYIGPRTVPIPHHEALIRGRWSWWPPGLRGVEDETWLPFEHRTPTVAWRGATTGRLPLSKSDRLWVVRSFQGVPYADVNFSGVTRGYTPRDMPWGIAAKLPEVVLARSRVQLDMDGNGNAWEGLRWKLLSGSTVVKVDPHRFVQWYYPKLQHGVHLWTVPSQDPSLIPVVERLRHANDTTSAALAANAKAFAKHHLTAERCLSAIPKILRTIEEYRTQRSWVIRKSS